MLDSSACSAVGECLDLYLRFHLASREKILVDEIAHFARQIKESRCHSRLCGGDRAVHHVGHIVLAGRTLFSELDRTETLTIESLVNVKV